MMVLMEGIAYRDGPFSERGGRVYWKNYNTLKKFRKMSVKTKFCVKFDDTRVEKNLYM